MQQEADRARSFTRRALVLGGAQLAFFGALAARLYHLQVQRSAEYALLAEDNRANQRLLIPPRGRILDRLGRPLARNVPTYRMLVVREQAARPARRSLQRVAALVRLPRGADRGRAGRGAGAPRLRAAAGARGSDLGRGGAPRGALAGAAGRGARMRACCATTRTATMLAHVLGYVGAVNPAEQAADADPLLQLPEFRIGKSGIERSYDRTLRGRAGFSRVEVNAIGREIRELDRREGEPGADLQLSLDLELQRFCVARLSSELSASAVVLDVRTGGGAGAGLGAELRPGRVHRPACARASGASCATTRARRWSTNASAASTRRARPSR